MSASPAPIRAWPFLVARGRHEGYRTLLAPRFLIDGDLHETLADATPSVEVGRLGRVVTASRLGPLGLTYTTEDLSQTGRDAPADTDTWTDEHGRPLEMLYGVVARQALSATLTVNDLDSARQEALQAYRGFLNDEARFAVRESQSYLLPGQPAAAAAASTDPPSPASGSAAHTREPDNGARASQPPRPPAIAHRIASRLVGSAVLAAVIAALLIWRSFAPHPANPVVTIVNATATPVSGGVCGSRTGEVTLQAQVTTNRPVQLVYRWQPLGPPVAPTAQTIKPSANPTAISAQLPAQSGPYRLVLDKPVHRERPVQCEPAIGGSGAGISSVTP